MTVFPSSVNQSFVFAFIDYHLLTEHVNGTCLELSVNRNSGRNTHLLLTAWLPGHLRQLSNQFIPTRASSTSVSVTLPCGEFLMLDCADVYLKLCF